VTPDTALRPPRQSQPAGAPAAPAGALRVWGALWIVYIIWGSTYLAIRIAVETMPPLLGAGVRFFVAGAVLVAVLAIRRGVRAVRPTRTELLSALVVGLLLPGANAVVSVAEQKVPSNLAALLIGSVPLWVILLRAGAGERPSARSVAAVLVGFAGVALLVRPGGQSGDATIVGLLACVGAAVMWASGSFASPRLSLPRDPLMSVAWQMLLGGVVILAVGFAAGEGSDVHHFSLRSVAALAYLIVFGSWVAYTAYAWLLQNAPISRVATYAYVNPVVAIVLGWLVLDEVVTGTTIAGAAIIITSVALVVRSEAPRRGRARR
jgi:drug/metabolite transporter (DMT)-like permease